MSTDNQAPVGLHLRDVTLTDLPFFFAHQLDPDANYMAAFTAKGPADHAAFMAHWQRILADPDLMNRTIVYDGEVAGSVARYTEAGRPEVTYWLGRAFWGRGIATAALAAFLQEVVERPIYARVAADNAGSLRVLQKCGFVVIGRDRGYANARGAEIEELILRLDGNPRETA